MRIQQKTEKWPPDRIREWIMSISSWEDPLRHFRTQSRWTILHVLMVASMQLTSHCPGASQKKTSNSSKYTINLRAHHIVPTRTIVANTQHQHNELNAKAINSKRVILSKSTWGNSKRTVMMFLEMNQKKKNSKLEIQEDHKLGHTPSHVYSACTST